MHGWSGSVVYSCWTALRMEAVLPSSARGLASASPFTTLERRQGDLAVADDEALEAHARRMFRLIYRIVGNVPDAQDLTQDALLKALRRRGQLRDTRKAAPWLNRIAVNTALDFVRRRGRVPFQQLVTVPQAATESPERGAMRSETRRWLNEGLRRLSKRERTALLLRDVEQFPAGEVAQIMGCSPATVRSHIANARVKFKRYEKENPR